ncbi:4Fe-4S binding protein [Candidatus Bipolaricaulota bacterium]|nr:4Fe-4S binding protein [Candidatus Bipolaricaulota bacterium]
MGRRAAVLALTVVVVMAAALLSLGQGFGEPASSFGTSESERTFTAPADDANQLAEAYFVHDQLLKLLLVLGFSLAGLGIIWTRRFALRRWLLLASVIVLGFVVGGLLCPISAVQNVILKASTGYLLLFLVPTVSALLVGRLFCGYVCPFGALQELLHVKRWRRSIPEHWMRMLRWLTFLLLSTLILRILSTGVLTWNGLTPFKAFFTLGGTPLTLGISGLFVLASIVLFRPFCRLFCPLGAWLSLVTRLSPFRIREASSCVSCGQCDKACASDAITKGVVRTADCLLCGECIRVCPPDALSICGKRQDDLDSSSEQSGTN